MGVSITLDELHAMWKIDGQINGSSLDGTTVKNALLHGKYLELLTSVKLRLKKKQLELDTLLKDKFLYYHGKMPKEEMDERGWPYDPYKGLIKPMKGDIEYWYNADKDIQDAKMVIEYQETLFEALTEILETIKWRHQAIKNIISIRVFEAGG